MLLIVLHFIWKDILQSKQMSFLCDKLFFINSYKQFSSEQHRLCDQLKVKQNRSWSDWNNYKLMKIYIVGCQFVVHLGGLVMGSPGLVPLRLRFSSLLCHFKATDPLNLPAIVSHPTYPLSNSQVKEISIINWKKHRLELDLNPGLQPLGHHAPIK